MLKTLRRHIMMQQGGDSWANYQQVEYLYGDGNSWFVVPNDRDVLKVTIDFSTVPQDTSGYDAPLFQVGEVSVVLNSRNAGLKVLYSGTSIFGTRWLSSVNFIYYRADVDIKDSNIDFKLFVGVPPSSQSYSNSYSSSPLLAADKNIYIYGNGVVNNKHKLFNNPRVYDNQGNLICDLLPCYRKSDLEVGLYDVINNVFYPNAGSGTFTVGADV